MFKNLCLTILLLFTVLHCFSATSDNVTVDSIINPKIAGTGYVSDAGHILNQATTAEVNAILKQLDTDTTAQVAVVLVNTIGTKVPKDFATDLFRHWQLGYKGLNNGLLILIVKDQRRVEFEVGYGLEGVIPDIISNRIQQQSMIPYLKKGDYNAAVLEGVKNLAERVSTEKNTSAERTDDADQSFVYRILFSSLACGLHVVFTFILVLASKKSKLRQSPVLVMIAVIFAPPIVIMLLGALTSIEINYIIVLIIVYCTWAIFYGYYFHHLKVFGKRDAKNISRDIQYNKWKEATRGLGTYTLLFPLPYLIFFYTKIQGKLKNLRYLPYDCPKCNAKMHLVTTDQESLLTDAEKCAEKLGGVTYDVWQCDNDENILKVELTAGNSKVIRCQKCKNFTAVHTDHKIDRKADYTHIGEGHDQYLCEFCKAEFAIAFILPQLIMSTPGNSSDNDSSSGSSSSGSSDSWGGGSSGGGGSGSSY
ncbi:uncharacterized protein SAMN06265348_102298 [Pedobacter westerhofensis]|uniref:TPM domain-containing protein n=1 Tax=Pedobacter westerhofensis TaxID=425512 RepID=A0A521BH80_9SPHI|nr:TPM domain-containing protein [Pedobacter westerhofensis]SMO46443.1 uncharacterized protein SAMN06265348_102298 [Pedobacter westerhofensis]